MTDRSPIEAPHNDLQIEVEGLPMSELGLEDAHILKLDGQIEKLRGFIVYDGEDILTALRRTIGYGATLYPSKEFAEQARDKITRAHP